MRTAESPSTERLASGNLTLDDAPRPARPSSFESRIAADRPGVDGSPIAMRALTTAAYFHGPGFLRRLTIVAVWLAVLSGAAPETPADEPPRAEPAARLGRTIVVANDSAASVVDAVASVAWAETQELAAAPVRVVELNERGERAVPSQLEPGDAPRLWWIVPGELASRSRRRYRVESGESPAGTHRLDVDRSPTKLVVRAGERRVLQYNAGHVEAPAGVDPKYGRSAHVHPVWTPSGAVVSDEFPPDHLHQSGVFLAYTKSSFEGRDPNFWDLAGGKGRVRFKRLLDVSVGPVFASLKVEHEHVDLTGGAEKVALLEVWDLRVWNVGGPDAGHWLWDVRTARRCATSSPLELPAYHYGGMALRGARGWTPANSRFVTSEGRGRADGNHSRPRWCDLTGPVDGRAVGLALFTHRDNFRFPEPLRIHPSMPYMVYTPSQLGDWAIRPDEPVVSQYRLAAHDGPLPAADADRLWRHFSEPPRVELETGP